ncbi:hypothetical protein [Granulicella mallensis]|uniref:Uncharacterized protein n=1 Tax=Granulicella mallensis (strain ATCC BAA-1857 / DSM 23137 / MP5ACTX8) TaxID=682795 RepID=G8P1B7_GRAMM|nr:hypothetical protein [Granulicella mallensis]AEU38135.1 hypothetical protein AciX8_3851 [Granulicella mallensis MP5ACTX8]
MKNALRSIAAVLSFATLFNQFAHAARMQNSTAAPDTTTQSAPIEQSSPATPPPGSAVPVQQIVSAHTVFLSNAGSDPNFPIDPTTSYNDVSSALQSWGRFQLVNSPEQADLIFQLRGVAPITAVAETSDNVYSITSPAFQLTLVDPRTNINLWTITSPVNLAGEGRALERWTSISITNLISRIKVLSNEPLSDVETANLTTVPPNHRLRTFLILGGIGVGAAVAGSVVLHHEFENSLSSQKTSQDQFCQAHNIPLSMCAGG